jgi:hypothetical protein
MANEILEDADIGVVEAHARRQRAHDFDADVGMVSGESLPDVVQERTDYQEVLAINGFGQSRRVRSGFKEMPVHGEAVIGVALMVVAYVLPLGHEVRHKAQMIQRLERWYGPMAAEEKSDERLKDPFGPRRRGRGSPVSEAMHGTKGDRQIAFSADGGYPPNERYVSRYLG